MAQQLQNFKEGEIMKIEINKIDSRDASKLLRKFLEMNEKSIKKNKDNGEAWDGDYIKDDSLIIGTDARTLIAYIYLESSTSLSLCLTADSKEFMIVYSSGLDGIEYERDLEGIKTLEDLEEILSKAYDLEDEIRGGDYNDDDKTDKWDEAMLEAGWNNL